MHACIVCKVIFNSGLYVTKKTKHTRHMFYEEGTYLDPVIAFDDNFPFCYSFREKKKQKQKQNKNSQVINKTKTNKKHTFLQKTAKFSLGKRLYGKCSLRYWLWRAPFYTYIKFGAALCNRTRSESVSAPKINTTTIDFHGQKNIVFAGVAIFHALVFLHFCSCQSFYRIHCQNCSS